MFGKQDPYLKINLLAYKVRTKTHTNAGASPVWNQTFSFDLDGRTTSFDIEAVDEDVGVDDEIGVAKVNIMDLIRTPDTEVFFPIKSSCGRKEHRGSRTHRRTHTQHTRTHSTRTCTTHPYIYTQRTQP